MFGKDLTLVENEALNDIKNKVLTNMENLTNNEKVLVVLDRTYKNQRSDDDFMKLEKLITDSLFNSGYEVDFKIMSTFVSDYEYDINSEALMKETDNYAAYACMNDYVCVIAEGFASWFWLQVIYSVPVICINPVLEPETEYEDFMTDELEYILKFIKKDRGFQTSECMCVISSENYEDVEEYDNIFFDNTVIRSDDMFDSEEFWTENGSIIKAIKYIKLNYA